MQYNLIESNEWHMLLDKWYVIEHCVQQPKNTNYFRWQNVGEEGNKNSF